jgi:hypothetical protein
VISVVRTATGFSFPEFEEGSQLRELIGAIARALGTSAHKPSGSPHEVFVEFEGYPQQFAFWWDGFTCELGCSAVCGVDLDAVRDRLVASGLFATT